MTLHPEHAHRQIPAINYTLATAPKIQEDLKAKFGHGENIFFYNDLVEYRLNNSRLDIAEDLDVKSRYGLTTNDVAKVSVSSAFRGHHNKDFFPEYQFNGLFGKVTNDYIRSKIEGSLIGGLINPETGVRYVVEGARKGGPIGGRASRGRGFWQTHPKLLEDICELKYEQGLTWDDTTNEFNRRHGTNYNSSSLQKSYQNNKHRLNDEEE